MTKDEFKKIVKGMKAVYTEPSFIPDNYAFDVWYSVLSDLDYELASKAVQKHMMVNRNTPRPADIREMVTSFYKGEGAEFNELTESAAWDLVLKALRNGIYGAEEEFEKLPPVIQQTLGSPQQIRAWAVEDEDVLSVISSNFMRSYRVCMARQKENMKIPQYVKDFFVTKHDVKEIEVKE